MPDESIRAVPGESTIFEIRPSKVILFARLASLFIAIAGIYLIFILTGLSQILIYIGVAIFGILIGLTIYLVWYYSIYRLTTKRVENRFGVIGSREEEITLDDVQAVDVENNFWGAIFNFGTVIIKAAGASREVDFVNIHDAKKIANKIEDLSTRYKRTHNIEH